MQTIGDKIKELRKSKRKSQEDLAYELGVSRQTIHKWENSLMQPSADNLKSLCKFFNVSSNYFFSDNENTVVDEVAISNVRKKSKKNLVICSIITAITLLALVTSVIFTAGVGYIVFSNNYGYVMVSMFVIDNSLFYLFLALSLILIAINIVMFFYIKKVK